MLQPCLDATCTHNTLADPNAEVLPAPHYAPDAAEGPLRATEIVRVTHDPRQLNGWALALRARGLAPLVLFHEGTFVLHVLRADLPAAASELDAIDTEERDTARARAEDAVLAARDDRPATRHAAWGAALMAVLLIGFFAVTGPRAAASHWFSAGASHAELVLKGELWRSITALSLHADSAHVLSNVGFGALVVGAVMRSEGIGWGSALVLASGAAGNLVNAWAHQALHSSVGFSTAVFGAIGLLGGLAYVRGARRVSTRRRAWTALGVTLALLAMFGTGGERTDIYAHLFGGLSGLALGLLVAGLRLRPRTQLGQWSAGLASLGVVVFAWAIALA